MIEHLFDSEYISETNFKEQVAALKAKFASCSNDHKLVVHCIEVRANDGLWVPCGFGGNGKGVTNFWPDFSFTYDFRVSDSSLVNRIRGRHWPQFYQHATEAAEQMKYMKSQEYEGTSYRIVRYPMPASWADEIAANAKWLEREKTRMLDGTYQDVPWSNEPWWLDGQLKSNHVAHVSVKTPHKIAYTPNHEYGAADRQISTSIGKYLKDFYSYALGTMNGKNSGRKRADGSDLYQDAFTYYQEQFRTKFGDDNSLHFAVTANEIEQVYINGPASCMGGQDQNWDSDIHPARVYAAGDLQLAYTKDAEGKITSRALVWPDKLLVGRIYGDVTSLQRLLTMRGYAEQNSYALKGARLAVIPYGRGYVMPFIDGDGCYTVGNKTQNGKPIFYLGSDRSLGSSERAGYQNGLDYDMDDDEEDTFMCESCENQTPDEEAQSVIIAHTYGLQNAAEMWCDDCASSHASECAYDHGLYSNNHFSLIEVQGYGSIVEHNLENIDYCVSALSGKYFTSEYLAGTLNGCADDNVSIDDVRCYKLTHDAETNSFYEALAYQDLINSRLDALTDGEALDQAQLHDLKQLELDLVLAKAA